MIENLLPPENLLDLAPAITAIVFTGDNEITIDDLAVGVESGEVIPLSDPAFGNPADVDASVRRGDVAALLGCPVTRVQVIADAVLVHASDRLRDRLPKIEPPTAASQDPTPPIRGPMDGSFEALLNAMDAAQDARFGTTIP